MNIYVPFTCLRAQTYEACKGATLVPLLDKEKGYGRYWAERWMAGEPFINVEQDVVPIPATLQEMWDCPHDYCVTAYCYPGVDSLIDRSPIGCAKFSAEFIAKNKTINFNGVHWQDPQYLIANTSLNLGHVHEPASLHLNPAYRERWALRC